MKHTHDMLSCQRLVSASKKDENDKLFQAKSRNELFLPPTSSHNLNHLSSHSDWISIKTKYLSFTNMKKVILGVSNVHT